MIHPVLHYDFRLKLIKENQRQIRAILGKCRCGASKDRVEFECFDCAHERDTAVQDEIETDRRINKGE